MFFAPFVPPYETCFFSPVSQGCAQCRGFCKKKKMEEKRNIPKDDLFFSVQKHISSVCREWCSSRNCHHFHCVTKHLICSIRYGINKYPQIVMEVKCIFPSICQTNSSWHHLCEVSVSSLFCKSC